jgi:CPA1 family monovalent cation:H+ antiporter
LIVFLTFCVILLTLVGQGLTLPPLIARLGLVDDGASDREYALARREGARAVIAYLDGLAGQKWVPSETAATMRGHYEHRLRHVPDSLDPADSDHDHLGAHDRLRQEIVNVERRTIVALRNSGQIGNEALRRAEYDLDLSELRSEE